MIASGIWPETRCSSVSCSTSWGLRACPISHIVFGGEEFVVIADGINADDAVTLGRACPPADRRFARRRLGWRDSQHRDRQLLTRCD